MAEIPIYLLIFISAYALVITGLLLAVVAGASKDITELKVNNGSLREALFEQAREAVKINREITEERDQHAKESEENRQSRLELMKKYIALQNEYSWYRIMMRSSAPVSAKTVEQQIQEHKHEKVG
jgi:DNA-directed RNA polymerase